MPVALSSWLSVRRLKSPDRTAVIHGEGERITYRELADDAARMSALLRSLGIGRGERVAILGENSVEFLVALFGTMQLGAVFVPVNTRLAPAEITHVLADSGARLLFCDASLAEAAAGSIPGTAVERMVRIRPAGTRGAADDTAAGNPADASAGGDLASLLAAQDPADGAPADDLDQDDPAAIIYTSGTTGRAKGAVLSHGNFTWAALNCVVDYDVDSTDTALMISPLFHVASLGMGALPIVMVGGTLVLERRFDPGRALALIEKHRVTMMSGVPTTYQMLADHPAWAGTDLSSMAKLTCGGSAVPTRILNAYEERGLSFSQGYGMTEAAPGVTALPPESSRTKQGSVGLPQFFTRVRVADPGGAPVPRGEVGEIQVSGPNVFLGYHGLPEATAASFTPDGWFKSGDLGRFDSGGYLFIADRLKDMIISGGENIYPAEIENVLYDIDGVTGAAVIGVADDRWGEVPCAVLTLAPGASLSTEEVRDFLAGKLAKYKIPRRVEIVDELPRTASGKLRKAVLRKEYAEG